MNSCDDPQRKRVVSSSLHVAGHDYPSAYIRLGDYRSGNKKHLVNRFIMGISQLEDHTFFEDKNF